MEKSRYKVSIFVRESETSKWEVFHVGEIFPNVPDERRFFLSHGNPKDYIDTNKSLSDLEKIINGEYPESMALLYAKHNLKKIRIIAKLILQSGRKNVLFQYYKMPIQYDEEYEMESPNIKEGL